MSIAALGIDLDRAVEAVQYFVGRAGISAASRADDQIVEAVAVHIPGGGDAPPGVIKCRVALGSGLIVHIQKMTMAAMVMADMKVWAQRS